MRKETEERKKVIKANLEEWKQLLIVIWSRGVQKQQQGKTQIHEGARTMTHYGNQRRKAFEKEEEEEVEKKRRTRRKESLKEERKKVERKKKKKKKRRRSTNL